MFKLKIFDILELVSKNRLTYGNHPHDKEMYTNRHSLVALSVNERRTKKGKISKLTSLIWLQAEKSSA